VPPRTKEPEYFEIAKLRIVKRLENQKIDLAVALSMGAYETMRLEL
jgi:hypothetical protein